jgi:hypothetical protein
MDGRKVRQAINEGMQLLGDTTRTGSFSNDASWKSFVNHSLKFTTLQPMLSRQVTDTIASLVAPSAFTTPLIEAGALRPKRRVAVAFGESLAPQSTDPSASTSKRARKQQPDASKVTDELPFPADCASQTPEVNAYLSMAAASPVAEKGGRTRKVPTTVVGASSKKGGKIDTKSGLPVADPSDSSSSESEPDEADPSSARTPAKKNAATLKKFGASSTKSGGKPVAAKPDATKVAESKPESSNAQVNFLAKAWDAYGLEKKFIHIHLSPAFVQRKGFVNSLWSKLAPSQQAQVSLVIQR